MVRIIIEVWRELRELRRKQQFSVTGHKLIIHKESADYQEDIKVKKLLIDISEVRGAWIICHI